MSEIKLINGIVAFNKKEYNHYLMHLSSEKEWPGININVDSRVTLNIPMLIMELYRLVPYKEDRYVHFHPFNMPYIKVRKIDLIGIVTNIRRHANNLSLTIEDGTGVVEINYKLEKYAFLLKQQKEIDEKYREQAKDLRKYETNANDWPKKLRETHPEFSYTENACLQNRSILENKWLSATNNDLLGKEVQLFDYVYINGYPCLDIRFQTTPEEITTEFMQRTRLTVYAISVARISEETYNEKLSMWMNKTICQRYTRK
ncbi:uncharacterized protein LOC116842686 isoform X2 [Odontomachus brunneus]|uniref:uncharacterized protein LOC116842686 isoform X2 n=1 Tax=Odontomachus brunneus TaxID=486640 RepID=UPI0013F24CB1|nr:uncharacterized protein LOC116842686 isoform X2 [Odontomachus brunneus]